MFDPVVEKVPVHPGPGVNLHEWARTRIAGLTAPVVYGISPFIRQSRHEGALLVYRSHRDVTRRWWAIWRPVATLQAAAVLRPVNVSVSLTHPMQVRLHVNDDTRLIATYPGPRPPTVVDHRQPGQAWMLDRPAWSMASNLTTGQQQL